MKKPLTVLCVIFTICSILTVSFLLKMPFTPSANEPQTSSQPTPQNTSQVMQPTDPALQQAVKNAVTYLEKTEHPIGLLMMNVLYRQFNISEFKDSLQRFDQYLASNPEPMTRLFRRIADYDTSVVQAEDFDYATDQLDSLTIPALYSDRMALPDDYLSRLESAMNYGVSSAAKSVNSGCYLLTHALLATIWLENNHCSFQLAENYVSDLYQANAALIGDGTEVNDLQLEAAAFLYEAGQGNLVNPDFIKNVIASQYTDGGWAITQDSPSNTDWHPTVLALMLLLHVQKPAISYPSMIASAPS